jgi:hypothetical protein
MNIPIPVKANEIVSKVSALMQPSGLFRSSRSLLGSSNLDNTKLGLLVLTEYISNNDDIKDITSTVSKLMSDSNNEKVSDPSLVSYLHALTGKKPSMEIEGASPSARVYAITESALALKYSDTPSTITSIVESLVILQSYKSRPVYIGINDNIHKFGKSINTNIIIKDAFGKNIQNSDVEVVSCKRDGKDKDIFKGPLNDNQLVLADDLAPGRYGVQLSIILPERNKPLFSTVYFSVQALLNIKDISVGITKEKIASDVDLTTISEENHWSGEEADTNKNDYIHVSFAISTPKKTGPKFQKPHQVFVRFTHEDTGLSSFFMASTKGTYSGKGIGGIYGVSVFLKQEIETFSYQSGKYKVSILVGDASYESVEYTLGSVALKFPVKDQVDSALYVKALLHTSDTTRKPLPEFDHVMRPPPKNAPQVMSMIFTLLAASPCLIFIKYILSLKPNLNYLNTIKSKFYAIFVGVICIVYALYWLAVPGFLFYDTIKYLIYAFPIMGVVGKMSSISVTTEKFNSNVEEKKEK